MTTPLVLGIALVVVIIVWAIRSQNRQQKLRVKRAEFIRRYTFPAGLRFRLDQAHPHFSGEQIALMLAGLRAYFQLVAANPRTKLGMPSKAVDSAWHEFILLTQNYADFCDKAFGKFLHHTPHHGSQSAERDALARTYGLSLGGISATAATGTTGTTGTNGAKAGMSPLGAAAAFGAVGAVGAMGFAGAAGATALSGHDLFTLDQTLGITDGNAYSPDQLSDMQKRYEQMKASSDGGGGGDSVGSGSDRDHGHAHGNSDGGGSDAGGSDGGGGGGCGGGCS